ncbi:tumor necrosis factor ligand superfamily member 14 isoform X2 [Pungitius pungitius]|uniref:tumor necrosis factor ligand superfamily member 14 isoform X2 n=1 Tax=Pungitius pungitius TaxID=134920 RepID=UPI002E0DCA68
MVAMSKGGFPPKCVVDTHTTRPTRPSQGARGPGAVQAVLFMLVSVALCGLAIEACFIYQLWLPGSATSASSSKLSAGPLATSTPESRRLLVSPSKPVAHLTGGQDAVHGKHTMAWSTKADPLLYEMDYKDKCLVIQKEGYYHVYSKISFVASNTFSHTVHWKTQLYHGNSIPLLMSRRSSRGSSHQLSSSYLAGVFHLTKNDTVFVEVSNTSQIVRSRAYENVFGAYMI